MKLPIMEYAFSLFLAIVITFFVGISVDVVYPQKVHYENGPSAPGASDMNNSYPVYEYDATREMNVGLIWLGIAGLFAVAGLTMNKKYSIFSQAMLGSAVFLIIGSFMRGGMGPNINQYRLASIAVILVLTVYFGYRRFLRQPSK